MTRKHCIMYAYALQPYQVSGGPAWLDTEHYSVLAKLENTADGKGAGRQDGAPTFRCPQRTNAHRVTATAIRSLPIAIPSRIKGPAYALTVAKSGFRLQPVFAEGGRSTNSIGNGASRKLTATRTDLAGIVGFLSRQVDRPVVDHTHLPGVYTFTLEWTPDDLKSVASSDQPPLPSIFTALQEQLGLKLEPQKVPVDIILVDAVERPSAN